MSAFGMHGDRVGTAAALVTNLALAPKETRLPLRANEALRVQCYGFLYRGETLYFLITMESCGSISSPSCSDINPSWKPQGRKRIANIHQQRQTSVLRWQLLPILRT